MLHANRQPSALDSELYAGDSGSILLRKDHAARLPQGIHSKHIHRKGREGRKGIKTNRRERGERRETVKHHKQRR